jgi:hypothetical protein
MNDFKGWPRIDGLDSDYARVARGGPSSTAPRGFVLLFLRDSDKPETACGAFSIRQARELGRRLIAMADEAEAAAGAVR